MIDSDDRDVTIGRMSNGFDPSDFDTLSRNRIDDTPNGTEGAAGDELDLLAGSVAAGRALLDEEPDLDLDGHETQIADEDEPDFERVRGSSHRGTGEAVFGAALARAVARRCRGAR